MDINDEFCGSAAAPHELHSSHLSVATYEKIEITCMQIYESLLNTLHSKEWAIKSMSFCKSNLGHQYPQFLHPLVIFMLKHQPQLPLIFGLFACEFLKDLWAFLFEHGQSCNRVDGETEVSVTDIPNFESLLVPPSLLFPCFQWKMHSRTLEALCADTYIQVNEGAFLIILTMRSAR